MKRVISVTIDDKTHELAKARGINISAETEKALKNRLALDDIPRESIKWYCSLCRKEISEGFLCREKSLFLCANCQASFNMDTCPHEEDGHHFHIRVPGFDSKNAKYVNEVNGIR